MGILVLLEEPNSKWHKHKSIVNCASVNNVGFEIFFALSLNVYIRYAISTLLVRHYGGADEFIFALPNSYRSKKEQYSVINILKGLSTNLDEHLSVKGPWFNLIFY